MILSWAGVVKWDDVQLFQIMNMAGYVVPVVYLLGYLVIKPYILLHILSSKRIKNFLNENSIGTNNAKSQSKILHDMPIPICSLK